MYMKNLLFLLLLILSQFTMAATIKTDVLVIGGGAGGVAAGIQSARSSVKTLIIDDGPWLGGSMTAGGKSILSANGAHITGIWGEFRKHVQTFYKNNAGLDTSANAILRFEPYTGAAILKKMTDTVKNLSVMVNTPWTNIKKDGTGWEVTIKNNGKTDVIKARVVIDGTETGEVSLKAGAKMLSGFESSEETGEVLATKSLKKIQNITWIAILKDYGRAADRTIEKPENYNPADYSCLLDGKNIQEMLEQAKLPNDKYLIDWAPCGNNYSLSLDDLNASGKQEFYQKAKDRTLGLVYYLQTVLGYKNLSFDQQEFNTADQLPLIPYIRESGRIAGKVRMVLDDIYIPYDRNSKLYRTSIGVGDALPVQVYNKNDSVPQIEYPAFPGYSFPMGGVIAKELQNFIVLEKALSVTHLVNASTQAPEVQMLIGQGAGAVAAYCAFFKTTPDHINIRLTQAEILAYGGKLMPFNDVPENDPHFKAFQRIGATGILRAVQSAKGQQSVVLIQPDSLTKTSDIQPVLNEIFTRSFLWFNKYKPGEYFTLENLLSYISEINLNEPKTLQSTTQNRWKSQFNFNSAFDLKKPLSRREFAVLVDHYLKPFNTRIDLTGKVIH
jgi:hypothetical protein